MMAAQNLDPGGARARQAPVFVPPAIATGSPDSEITLRDLALILWRGKWIIAATVLIAVSLVGAWMKIRSPLYTATMVVAPANETGAGELTSRLSQFTGIAALAGINLPEKQAVSPFDEFMEIIKSNTVAERLASRHGILPRVFEKRWNWNPENRTWTRRESLLAPVGEALRAFFDLPPPSPPTPRMLAEYLDKELTISAVETSGMQRVEFSHRDPRFAADLLRWLHEEGDGVIREEREARTSRQIDYIETKLQVIAAADHRRSLVQLLLDQEKQMMMIQVDLPFAARIIEPPNVSDDPTFPRPPLFIALAVVIGVLLGVLMVFLWTAMKRRPEAEMPDAPSTREAAGTSSSMPPRGISQSG